MNNKFDLKTNFLYQPPLNRDYMIGGGVDLEYNEWLDKFEDEEIMFGEFIRNCSFEELIESIIFLYKKKHPNFSRLIFKLFDKHINENQFKTIYSIPERTDLVKATEEYLFGELIDDVLMEYEVYEKSIHFEFTEEIPVDLVDDVLEGLVYEKSIDDAHVLYTVQESPIAVLTLNSKSFKIELNQDYVIQYHKM